RRLRPPVMPASHCATRWAPLGTLQTPRCFWRPMRRISLPALRCRSMAARSSTSIEPQLRGVATTPIGQRRPNEEEAKWTRLSSAWTDVVAIANGARDHEQAKARIKELLDD